MSVSFLLLQLSGAILAPVSVLFMLYALVQFKRRTRQILTLSTTRYDDQHGPVLLTLLLAAVTLMVVVLGVLSWRASLEAGSG